jgi:hypothetical protein
MQKVEGSNPFSRSLKSLEWQVSTFSDRGSGGIRAKVNGELDRSGSGTEEPRRIEVRKQPSHGVVVGQHERGEPGDALH